jgi:hypothetical protein
MAKLFSVSLFCLLLFAACDVNNQREPLLAPLSISGKIDCPQRNLTVLNPNEYLITLHDSAGLELKRTRPNASCKYAFEDLTGGKTYEIRVKRTVANPPIFSSNQVKTYFQQTPRPQISDLALFAADVDKNGEIDATDVLHVDRFIGGITSSMPGGIWTILPSYLIGANNNVFSFNTPSPLKNLIGNITNFDFIVVTLGDVSLNRCD